MQAKESKIAKVLRHVIFGHQSTFLFLKGLNQPRHIIRQIKEEAKKIQETEAARVVDAPSRGHLEFTSHILAAYKLFFKQFGDEEKTITFLKQAMLRGFDTWWMRGSLGLMLYFSRNRHYRLYTIFDNLMRQYGISFKWQAPHKHENKKCSFTLTITRCFYFEFFKAQGVPNLTQVLCQLDGLWFKQVDPNKHGFYFDVSRYQTQGYGADKCLFPIVEK